MLSVNVWHGHGMLRICYNKCVEMKIEVKLSNTSNVIKKFQSLDNRYYFKLLEKDSDIAQSVLEIRKCLSW